MGAFLMVYKLNKANGRIFEGSDAYCATLYKLNKPDGRIFDGFALCVSMAVLLRSTSSSGEVYASDLIYECSLGYGCRPQGRTRLGLAVRAHARGARPPFRGRNLRSSLGSSFGGSRRGVVGKRLKGEKGERGERRRRKDKTRAKMNEKTRARKKK
jgi:hypothetical protein